MQTLSQSSIVTLGNATELAVNILQGVMGNEVADQIGNSPVTREVLYNLAQTTFQKNLAAYVGVPA